MRSGGHLRLAGLPDAVLEPDALVNLLESMEQLKPTKEFLLGYQLQFPAHRSGLHGFLALGDSGATLLEAGLSASQAGHKIVRRFHAGAVGLSGLLLKSLAPRRALFRGLLVAALALGRMAYFP